MFFAALAGYLLSFLEQLAQGMLHLPEAVWVGGRPSLLALFVYYAALALFCALAVQRQKKVRRRGCLWLLGIPLVFLSAPVGTAADGDTLHGCRTRRWRFCFACRMARCFSLTGKQQ
ncbi:MAG: hypothetical protein ACLTSZ_12095 [Lachnospiraceae bacterium]